MYSRIPESEYRKLLFQLRSQMAAILNVFNCYGLNNDVTQAVGECVKVAENFGMALRGKSTPIHILTKPKRRVLEDED